MLIYLKIWSKKSRVNDKSLNFMGVNWYSLQLVPMSHAGPADGDILNRQITGQKRQSGGCNPGAVASPIYLSSLSPSPR